MITITILLFLFFIYGTIGYFYHEHKQYYREKEARGDFSHWRPTRERKLVRGRRYY